MTHLSLLPRLSLAGLGAVLSVTAANAQTTLIEEGDLLATVANGPSAVTRIDDVAVNDDGDWLLVVATDGPSTSDLVVLHNGNVLLQEGEMLGIASPAGAYLLSVGSIQLTDLGDTIVRCVVRLSSGQNATVVLLNGNAILQSSITLVNVPGVAPGSTWDIISEVWANDANQLLVGGKTGSSTLDLIAVLDHNGTSITSGQLLAIDGTTLPGHPTPIQGFSFSRRRQALNNSGTALWFVDDDHVAPGGSTANDSWVYRDNAPLWREGDPMASHLGSTYGSLFSVELDLNDSGDYVYQGGRDASFSMDVIVVNDSTVIAEAGAAPPGISGGPFVLTRIGSTTGVFLGNDGSVVWYGDWDDPNTDIDTAIFRDGTPIIQEGVSTVNGNVIDSIAATDKTFAVSDSGRYLVVEVFSIDPSDPAFNGAYLYDLWGTIGTSYCGPAVANSTGSPATITAQGSTALADNDLTLLGADMPLNAFTFCIVSATQGFSANPGGSMGNICLAGSVGRAVGNVIPNTGSTGRASVTADLNAIPHPSLGTVATMAGDTWNFQFWYRDAVGGMATSNFTDGVSVTFN